MHFDKDSRMECPRHGLRKPAFVCRHLRDGVGLGFHEPAEPADPELSFKSAWCDACERARMASGGEWDDESESFARPLAICEGCLTEIRARNR